MAVIRCTAKLLKRLRLPAKPPEPPPADNPLGEWYADIDFIDREPFVVMLNAATGAGLVLPGRAQDLRSLHIHAGQQFFKICNHCGISLELPKVAAELQAWQQPPAFAATRDRSLRLMKDDAWHHFGYVNRSLPDAALRQWEGLFTHPSLPKQPRFGQHWAPLQLVLQRLVPPAEVIELRVRGRSH